MATTGQFNAKNPTIKRILKEAAELASNPSPDLHAAPLETNLLEWHFTLRGPPNSPYSTGLYHGRIVLPPSYPLRPPSFRFLTPSGRFEVNREICLSISGHHEESWQPAWGVRTALVAIRAFMESEVAGQVGGLVSDAGTRKELAGRSRAWCCRGCGTGGKTNAEILKEAEEAWAASAAGKGADGGGDVGQKQEEDVPEELRLLGYRDDLGQENVEEQREISAATNKEAALSVSLNGKTAQQQPRQRQTGTQQITTTTISAPVSAAATPQRTTARRQSRSSPQPDQWIDRAIYIIGALLAFLVLRKMLAVVY